MSITKHPDESELLVKIAGRDQRAFKMIYDHYRPLVYSFALKYLKSAEQSEEVVQEVFLKIWRLQDQLLTIHTLDSYILTMTRNRSFDFLRRMKLEFVHMEPLSFHIDHSSNDTEEGILLRDTKRVLDAGIALLPPQQRLVYTLCHIEGKKHEDVASELQLSPETVKRHMKLALKFLRSYLGKHTDISAILIILKLF